MELSHTKTKRCIRQKSERFSGGFSVLEILLSVALFGLLVTALMGAYVYNAQSEILSMQRERGLFIANEGIEATRNIRDQSFDLLQPGIHGLSRASNIWEFSSSFTDITEDFSREITIKSIDTNSVRVISRVKWNSFFDTKAVSLETILTRWRSFPWQDPGQDSVLSISINEVASGIRNIGNLTYLIRPISPASFLVIDHFDLSSSTILSQLALSGKPNAMAIQGNYAYVATSDAGSELQIINIGDPSAPFVEGTYNASGSIPGLSVAVVGTTVFLGRGAGSGPELLSFDVSTPSAPILLGSIDPNISITDMSIRSTATTYGYVTSTSDTSELLLLKISSPSSFGIITPINLPGTEDATSLDIENGILTVGRKGGSLMLFNLPDLSTPVLASTLAISGDVNDLDMDPGATKVFLAVGSVTEGFQVINIASPAAPSVLGVRNLGDMSYAIHYDDALDRAFLGAGSTAGDFIMLRPYP